MNEEDFTNLSEKTQLQIWENNEMLEWLNSKARQEEYLQKQLQAYKDKEKKLIEYIKDLEKDNLKDLSEFEPKYIFESIIFAIKQILNEGSDK